jgi:hypothetical protein
MRGRWTLAGPVLCREISRPAPGRRPTDEPLYCSLACYNTGHGRNPIGHRAKNGGDSTTATA